jgi:hypothetical protein
MRAFSLLLPPPTFSLFQRPPSPSWRNEKPQLRSWALELNLTAIGEGRTERKTALETTGSTIRRLSGIKIRCKTPACTLTRAAPTGLARPLYKGSYSLLLCLSFPHHPPVPQVLSCTVALRQARAGGAHSRLIRPVCHPNPKMPHRPSRLPHHDAHDFPPGFTAQPRPAELLSSPSFSTDGGPVNVRISMIPSISLAVEPRFIR